MRVLVATDAWHPQVNGVVRTLEQTAAALRPLGAEMVMLSPQRFRTVPMPSYPQIRLALATPAQIERCIDEASPDAVHIATEGPIGFLARRACLARGMPFTTSYHTRFPEYLAARAPIPEGLSYAYLRRFHNAGAGTMISTRSMEADLTARGFRRLMRWSRGVDADLFRPRPESMFDLPRPIFLTVARVAKEKNLPAFLGLDLPGSKVVVGDGPAMKALSTQFPDAHFIGAMAPERLAIAYASADVFVFPSLTDTFGIVLLEAMASGLPVAAFPVPGPLDVVAGSGAGVLDDDLRHAALTCVDIDREACRAHALTYSWEASAAQFIDNIRRSVVPALSARPALA
jgi:glycosyltransferase involved in cell wall biosynthesis